MLSNCNAIISDSTSVRVARVNPVSWERSCAQGEPVIPLVRPPVRLH